MPHGDAWIGAQTNVSIKYSLTECLSVLPDDYAGLAGVDQEQEAGLVTDRNECQEGDLILSGSHQ
jgi:hypothetical protein